MLEKTEGATKNGRSRDTGNIGHTRHRTKTNNNNNKKPKHNTTQTTKEMSNTNPSKKSGVNLGAREG
jgi:hypothetical protein